MGLPTLAEIKEVHEKYDMIRVRYRALREYAVAFQEKVFGNDEKFWEDAEKHPDRFKARFVLSQTYIPKASLVIHNPQNNRKQVTADDLEGLSDDEIERLAAVNEKADAPTQD